MRYRVVVHGKVQGVWFRESCRRIADRLGLDGWVTNRGDGAVEAEFEGPLGAVAQAVSWCRQGPPSAEVAGVDVTSVAIGDTPGPRAAARFQVR